MNKKEYNKLVYDNVKNENARRDIIKYKNDIKDVALVFVLISGITMLVLAGQLNYMQDKLADTKTTALSLANKVCSERNMGNAFQVYEYNNGMIIECQKGDIRYSK